MAERSVTAYLSRPWLGARCSLEPVSSLSHVCKQGHVLIGLHCSAPDSIRDFRFQGRCCRVSLHALCSTFSALPVQNGRKQLLVRYDTIIRLNLNVD